MLLIHAGVQVSDSNEKVSTLQSLLQVQSRAATMMLVREDPGVLDLTPAFVMQRLVDLKVHHIPRCLTGTCHDISCFAKYYCFALGVRSQYPVLSQQAPRTYTC